MRGEAFTRQLRLLQLLEARNQGVEVDEAASELGTGRRTVYRDFRVLEEAGFPLRAEQQGRRARWRLVEGYRHRLQPSLTWAEMFALALGRWLAAGLAGTLLHDAAESALEKLRAAHPRELGERLRAAGRLVSVSAGGHDYRERGEVVRLLLEALDRKRTVVVRYRSRTPRGLKAGSTERRLDPYHLRVEGQGLYLLAWCHRARALRTFLVDRIQELRPTDEGFEVPAGFDPEAVLAPAFGMWSGRPRRVRLVVAAQVADLLMERKLHPSQVAQRRADGTLEVWLRVAVGPPLVSCLLGLGPALLELEPRVLREAVVAAHRRALLLLDTQPSPEV